MRGIVYAILTLVLAVPARSGEAPQPAGYPDRPVTIIVPYAQGGGLDRCSRLLARHLDRKLGQSVLVENVTRGGNVAGNLRGINAAPDGYTWTAFANGLVTDHLIIKNADYTQRDVEPICMIANDPHLIVVGKKFAQEHDIKTLADLIACIRDHPGRITYGAGGNWTTHDFLRLKIEDAAGARMARMAFLGGAPALAAVTENNCDVATPILPEYMPYADDPNHIALAIAAGNRVGQLPNLPTTGELGYPELHQVIWRVLAVPKGTSPAIVSWLERIIHRTMIEPDFIEDAVRTGVTPLFMGSAELVDFLEKESDHYERRTREWGVRIED